jgi:ubiquinone biosynthesis protein UbiJ
MDADAIITILTGAAGVTGGFFGGKKLGNNQAQQTAVSTVELLQVAVAELERQGRIKDEKLADLQGRIGVLEDMVTQRAEVAAVHEEVKGVRTIVERIADKVDA